LSAALIIAAAFLVNAQKSAVTLGLFLVAQACIRLAVFNISLNIFRGDPWDYVSPTTTSILDKIEREVFGQKVWILEAILVGIFIFIQTLI
jgi:hypothetical protein